MSESRGVAQHILSALVVLVAMVTLAGCGSFGRKFNQALPDFLRSDPGADEMERYQARIRVLNRSKEEAAQAKEAYNEAKGFYDSGDYDNATSAFENYLEDYPDTIDDRMAPG